jgi:hypothetical protein
LTNNCNSVASLAVNLDGLSCGADFKNSDFLAFTDFDAFVVEFEAGC